MAQCLTCGNDYDKTFEVSKDGRTYTFDSFECAIHRLAPECEHCRCRVLGHGVEEDGAIYCCASCARAAGKTDLCDRGNLDRRRPEAEQRPAVQAAGPAERRPSQATTKDPVFHVRSVDGEWFVFDTEGHRRSEMQRAQSDGVVHAKELARRAGCAQIIVHREDGSIASEFFYQRDERSALVSDDSVATLAASKPARARRPRAGT